MTFHLKWEKYLNSMMTLENHMKNFKEIKTHLKRNLMTVKKFSLNLVKNKNNSIKRSSMLIQD